MAVVPEHSASARGAHYKTGGSARVGLVLYKRNDANPDDADDADSPERQRQVAEGFIRFVTDADNEALLDAILYDWYPNALPGDLDGMDLPRFWRMVQAKSIMAAEDTRRRQRDGEKPPQPSDKARYREAQRHWATIKRNDELLAQLGLLDDE